MSEQTKICSHFDGLAADYIMYITIQAFMYSTQYSLPLIHRVKPCFHVSGDREEIVGVGWGWGSLKFNLEIFSHKELCYITTYIYKHKNNIAAVTELTVITVDQSIVLASH